MRQRDLEFALEVVETDGSVDNVRHLISGQSELAILQNDIAYLAEQGLPPFEHRFDGMRAVWMLYPEPIVILTDRPDLKLLSGSVPSPVATGPPGSGLYFNTLTLLKATGSWDPMNVRTSGNLALDLEQGRIHLGFANRLDDDLAELIRVEKAFLVSVPTDIGTALTHTYPFYETYELQSPGSTASGIAVKAMLVVRDGVDEAVVDSLARILLEERDGLVSATAPGRPFDDIGDPVGGMTLSRWHPAAKTLLLQQGLILASRWEERILALGAGAALLIILVLLFNIIARLRRNTSRFSFETSLYYYLKRLNLWLLRWKYLVLALMLASVFTYIVFSIEVLERRWAIANNTTSSFAQQDFRANLLWMLVFSGSGYEDRLFPRSPEGKFLATILPLLGVSGVLTLVGLLTTDHIKRHILEIRGLRSQHMEEHILICGWSPAVPKLVASLTDKELETRRPVMILAETEHENLLLAHGIDHPDVAFTRGSATRRADLLRAQFPRASTAIIVAEESAAEPDAINVLKVLTIEKLSRELEATGGVPTGHNIYTIAEISDPANYETLARDAMVDEIVSIGHIESSVLVQSALNHGVSTFLNEILTFNQHNEFYSHRVRPRGCLSCLTYDQLLHLLRREHILLLAISLECGGDQVRQAEVLAEHGLRRSMLTNPSSPEELVYRTRPGDLLIVLAESESHLRTAVKRAQKHRKAVESAPA